MDIDIDEEERENELGRKVKEFKLHIATVDYGGAKYINDKQAIADSFTHTYLNDKVAVIVDSCEGKVWVVYKRLHDDRYVYRRVDNI